MPELHCETITFPSSDGRHTSSAVLYTMPGKPVRAVLQLSHGMCEYVLCPYGRVLCRPRYCPCGQ